MGRFDENHLKPSFHFKVLVLAQPYSTPRFALNDAGRPIVTTLAARLVEKGVIDWDTKVT